MTVELVGKIPAIRKALKKGLPASMREPTVEETQETQVKEEYPMTERELEREVKRLHGVIKDTGEILAVPGLDGKLSLGTDVEEIRWDLMGANIAGYFRPEFEFQPEDITDFYIKYKSGQEGGQQGLEICLDRMGSWWSYIIAEAYNRKDDGYISPSITILCSSDHGQIAAARRVREDLDDYPTRRGGQIDTFLKEIKNLGLVTEVVSFTIASLEQTAKQACPHAEI
jgi:hypothetical protein